MGRGLIALLIASLAVNVFLGGYVVGRKVARPPHGEMMEPGGRLMGPGRGGMLMQLESMSPQARDVFRSTFDAGRPALQEHRRQARSLRRAFADALAAEHWDRAGVDAAAAVLLETEGARRAAQNKLLIDAFEKLSVEDRKTLIEAQKKSQAKGARRFRRCEP